MSAVVNASQPPAGITAAAAWKPRARDWWLLAAGLALLLLTGYGSRGLNNPDEGRYANIAAAMERTGDWWEPRQSGLGHYDKPPLIYWCTAASLRAFGHNEWAARMPSVLGGVMILVGVAWTARRLYGSRVAWWAGLIGGTSLQVWVFARVLSPDAFLAGWCTLAVAAWAECRHRGGAWRWWFVQLAFWTLAWWTKATASLVPLAGLFVGILATGDRAGRRALRPWLLLPAILAFGLPWYLSMLRRYPELYAFFFQRELVDRMIGRVDGRHGPIFYYLPICLLAWLPWWPVALVQWFRTPGRPRVLVAWRRLGVEAWIALVGVTIFSLVSSKLPTYTLSVAPWAALTLARVIGGKSAAAPTCARVSPALGFLAFAMTVNTFLPSRIETSLGSNCTTRPVCQFLRAHGAVSIDSDHYWPDMEFYLPEAKVRYLARTTASQRERPTDYGTFPNRFVDPLDWLGLPDRPGAVPPASGERWLVRFRAQGGSPFEPILRDAADRKVATFGQFDLYHLNLADGHFAGPPSMAKP